MSDAVLTLGSNAPSSRQPSGNGPMFLAVQGGCLAGLARAECIRCVDSTCSPNSGNWSGIEDILLTENILPSLRSHQFLVSNLSGYSSPLTLKLGYQVHVNGADGPGWDFLDVNLGVNTSGSTVDVWKDVYQSLADFNAGTTPGSGTLAALHSHDGSLASPVTFSSGLTDLWIRDTVQLSGLGGQLSSFGNTLREVPAHTPEIDPASCGCVVALLMGSLGLLECRVRRRTAPLH